MNITQGHNANSGVRWREHLRRDGCLGRDEEGGEFDTSHHRVASDHCVRGSGCSFSATIVVTVMTGHGTRAHDALMADPTEKEDQ
jgi:hydroxymethylpyrimidine/phosphomethylpyrimidine kinase